MFAEQRMAHEKQGSEPGTEVEMEQARELWVPVPLFTPLGASALQLQTFR